MPFKVTFGFSQNSGPRQAGWTMSFYANVTSPGGFNTPAGDHIQFLRDRLWQLTGNETVAAFARLQNLDPPFASSIIAYNFGANAFPLTPANDPGVAADSDYPATSGVLRLIGQTGASTRIHIRGIADPVVGRGGRYFPAGAPDYPRRVNQLITYLTVGEGAAIWRIRYRTATPELSVTGVTDEGVATIPGHAFQTGHIIRIKKAKGLRHLNGQWRLGAVTATTVQLLGWNPRIHDGPYEGGAVAYRLVYDYTPIVAANLATVSARRVGRPFIRFTGRRTAEKR